VLCVDAIHFAPRPDAAYCEIRRILTSGGRAVLTDWEPLERDDQRLPGRLRRVDLGAGLTAAGFEAVEVRDRPGWRASERAMWQEAAALDPGDDPALRSFHDEGVRSAGNLRSGPPGHSHRQRTVGHPHIRFPSPTASEPAAERDRLIEVSRTRSRLMRGREVLGACRRGRAGQVFMWAEGASFLRVRAAASPVVI
jgi:SAM-dependent methyltransferase